MKETIKKIANGNLPTGPDKYYGGDGLPDWMQFSITVGMFGLLYWILHLLFHPTLEHTRNSELERKMRNQMRYWIPRYKSRVKTISKNIKNELVDMKFLDETHHPSVDGHEYIAQRFYDNVP